MSKRDEAQRPARLGGARRKLPVNPSIFGTAKQAGRAEKGGRIGADRRVEGRGHPSGGGRGGKSSTRH